MKIEQEADRKDRLKKIVFLNNQHYCFYQRGQVYLVDEHFGKQARKLTFSKTETILFVSHFNNRIVLLSKDKEALILSYFQIEQTL